MLTRLAELAPEDSLPRARLLWVAAVMAASQNDYGACPALSEESLRIGTAVRDVEVVAWSLVMAAMPRWVGGDLAGALQQFESALSLARLMRLEQAELNILNTLCGIWTAAGDLDRAVEAGEQGLVMSKASGELWVRGFTLNFLAQATWLRGDRPRADALAREAVACKHAIDDRNGLTIALGTLAWMAAECGQPERAATLVGSAQRVCDESSLTLLDLFREQHERSVSLITRAIGQKAYDAAFARGSAMTIGEGVAFAVADQQVPKPMPSAKAASDSVLTHRQLEIAGLIAADLTNRQIADRLFLSERTVETHITNMLNKLGLNSRVQLSRWLAEEA
jgi:DNA-binding CsgD family transcriptional regulator